MEGSKNFKGNALNPNFYNLDIISTFFQLFEDSDSTMGLTKLLIKIATKKNFQKSVNEISGVKNFL